MRKLLLFSLFIFGCVLSYGQTKTTQVSFSGSVNGYYVKASGELQYRFVWAVYPEVKAEFRTLEITQLNYNGVSYDRLKNKGRIKFPYSGAGFPTKTSIRVSMPLGGGFNTVTRTLYGTSGYTSYDFTTSSFKQNYNSKSTEQKKKVQLEWESKPFVADVSIVELDDALINRIIQHIKWTLEEEKEEEEERLRKEKEEEEERLRKEKEEEEERLRKEKEEEEERLRKEKEEEERLRKEEEERIAAEENSNNSSGGGGSGGSGKKKKKSNKDKKAEKERKAKEEKANKEAVERAASQYRLHAEAYNKARQAEASGNIAEAIRWYKVANGYSYNMEVQNKIKALEQQQNINNLAAGTAGFVVGMNDAFKDLDRGRIMRGTFTSAFHYAESTFREDLASRGSKGHFEGYMALDFYMWAIRYKLGLHMGIFGTYAMSDKESDEFISREDSWDFDSEKLEVGVTGGINLFGLLEVDYLYRGLMLKGEYLYRVPNTSQGFGLATIDVPFGGPLHFDGGLRAAIYLARRKHFFIRGSAWYINGSEEGMLATIDPKQTDQTVYTESQGFRIELVRAPWSFGFFRSYNSYNNLSTNPLTVDTWGIGLLFGTGMDR